MFILMHLLPRMFLFFGGTNFAHISPSSENPAIILVHPSEPVPEKQEQPKSDQLTALNNSANASPGVLVLGKSSSLGARSDVITFLRYGHITQIMKFKFTHLIL